MKKLQEFLIDILASGFRSGYAPVASGTFGTLVAIPFVIVLRAYVSEITYIIVTTALILISFYIAHRAEELYNEPDSGKIVIDEIAGYFVSCLFLPVLSWDVLAFAFFAFRFFDIVKLWPANFFDQKQGGVSVVLDDVFAGAYANLSVQLYFYLKVLLIVAINTGM